LADDNATKTDPFSDNIGVTDSVKNLALENKNSSKNITSPFLPRDDYYFVNKNKIK
jgi:hypothetical protein